MLRPDPMDRFSFLSNSSPEYVEQAYKAFRENPLSVEEGWRHFFDGFDFARKDYSESGDGAIPENVQKEFRVIQLIHGYRQRGHLFTHTNPVRERRTNRTLSITIKVPTTPRKTTKDSEITRSI